MGEAPLPHDARGAGHPVVLIHAQSVDQRMWDYQMDAFAERFRVIRYDLRNHGSAPVTRVMYDADRDLLDLLDALDVGVAHLVGAELGGNIAVEFALQHPQRVSALVLAGGGLPGSMADLPQLFEGMAPMMEDFMSLLQSGDPAPFVDRLLAEPHSSPGRADSRELLRRMLLDNMRIFIQYMPGMPRPIDPPASGRLAEIGAPTLVMVGERDTEAVKRMADDLHQGIRGATKMVVAGAGHLPNLDDPAVFNETVLDFLSAAGP